MQLLDSYYYDDGCEPCGEDTFSREPFIVKFLVPETGEHGGGGRRESWQGLRRAPDPCTQGVR